MQDKVFSDLDKHELLQTLLANRLLASGLGRLVVALAESIADETGRQAAIATAIQYLAVSRDFDGAVALASRHFKGKPKALALVAIASELTSSNYEAASAHLREAEALLGDIKDEDERVHLLQQLSNGFLGLKQTSMALQLARLIAQSSERAYTLSQIARGLWNEGHAEEAALALEEARSAAANTSTPDRPSTWDDIARLLVLMGRTDEAVRAWERAIEFLGESHDPDKLLLSICKALMSIGYGERARETALTIENEARRQQALTAVDGRN